MRLPRFTAISALIAGAALLVDATRIHIRVHHPAGSKLHITKSTTPVKNTTTTTSSNPSEWHMQPVVSIQARVQGNTPTWDNTTGTWVASFGKTYDERYRSVLDTVNTASVEGALMYVQAEGINVKEQSVKCERKNKMQYVLFYEITVVQPNASIAYYDGKHSTLEYCPFAAMDGGKCTESGTEFPDQCKQYHGLDGQPNLGHCVGSNEQASDPRAPYPGNYWFSYPNSCPYEKWGPSKTEECRAEYPGGLCPPGVKPDGVTCTYAFKILGYLNLDDLVGITDGTAAADGKAYRNFTEFCHAGNVEFSATNTGKGFEVEESIAFWEKPGDPTANAERTIKMIEKYNTLAPESAIGKMSPLPDMATLAKSNPPCYANTAKCATAAHGCKRVLYSQLCEVCKTADPACVKAPAGFKFPVLVVPEPETEDETSGSGNEEDASGSIDEDGSKTSQTETTNEPTIAPAPAPTKKNSAATITASAVIVMSTIATMIVV